MSMKHIRIVWLSMIMLQSSIQLPVDSLSGAWSDVKNFPLFQASFWKNLGRGFGIPPSGYVYSFTVYNDSNRPVWIGTQNIISLMGGCFPEAGGWNIYPTASGIAPGSHYTDKNKEYYFEMFIKSTPDSYSNHMPYLQHSDVLYQQDCIQLEKKHSQHLNCFRVYTGRDFENGAYVHRQKAEYLGYINMSGQKDPNQLVKTETLSGLTVKNSTQQDYYIGFAPQSGLTTSTMTQSLCSIFGLIAQDSFAILSTFSTLTSLRPGTLGVFDATTKACLQTVDMGVTGFKDMPYTVELYQDAGSPTLEVGWQGIVSGHFDMPTYRVRDITPILGCLWYQSAQQAGSGIDLPGTVWIVALGSQAEILGMATPGQAVQFMIMRPELGLKKQIYFLYVNEANSTKAQAFIQRFISGAIGSPLTAQYKKQATELMSQAALQLQPKKSGDQATSTAVQVSQALMSQAVQGSLQMNKGQIVDSVTGVTGYLLGSDLFLPLGIGPTPMYYSVAPSIQTPELLPTSAVINLFAQESVTSAPKGMPTPIQSQIAASIATVPAIATTVTSS